jgi:hypothetical protein
MRRLIPKLVFGLLLLSLAALELPELLTLTDNTSNDFSLLALDGEPPAVSVVQNLAPPPRVSNPPAPASRELSISRFDPSILFHLTHDALHCWCIQRI